MTTTTRNFLAGLLILIVLAASPAGIAAEPHSGDMIDAHGHLGASFDWNTIVKVMDSNKVSRQIVMARYYGGPTGPADLPGDDDLALQLSSKHPGRFFPLVGMQRPDLTGASKWFSPDASVEAILKETEERLETGRFFGIGEIIVKHFAYSPGRHAEQDNPIYSSFMQRLSMLARRFDVPVVFHMEGAPHLVEDLSRLLRENPEVRYVWSHNCGRSTASVIRSMLENHPNLYGDLACMTNVGESGYGTGWPRMEAYNALIEKNGLLFPEMRELYDAFPDRFMIGMDVAHAPGMNPKNYGQRARRFRELLSQLSPRAAEAFAQGNAARIFRLNGQGKGAP